MEYRTFKLESNNNNGKVGRYKTKNERDSRTWSTAWRSCVAWREQAFLEQPRHASFNRILNTRTPFVSLFPNPTEGSGCSGALGECRTHGGIGSIFSASQARTDAVLCTSSSLGFISSLACSPDPPHNYARCPPGGISISFGEAVLLRGSIFFTDANYNN